MEEFISKVVLTLYITASVLLMIYGLHCYLMIILFLRKQKKNRLKINTEIESYYKNHDESNYPFVTIQLPVYNELDVVKRLIHSATEIDYPKDKYEIQIVDDSNDETIKIIDKTVAEIAETGIDICVVRRDNRDGFKAGGLANALKTAKGKYSAIFDSDFLVPKNFLKRTIALIEQDDKIACLQGRWGHLNRKENWLTRAQSVGIDGHFAAEQGARSYNNMCMNFNGTAGIWRISAIAAGGGWQGDTITEDLDLSYRVQLEGYKIKYDFDLECLAELPNNIVSLKSQQRRWAKGSMETAIKLLPRIFKSERLSLFDKVEAFLHLTHYFVAVLMMTLCVLTLPVLLTVPMLKAGWILTILWTIIVISAVAPCTMYTGSGIVLKKGWFSFSHFPAMLAVGTGLCINNAQAVFEAFIGYKTAFIRTPKSGSLDSQAQKGTYHLNSKFIPAFIEIILGLYCLYTFSIYVTSEKYLFGFFIGAYAFGLLTFGLHTLTHQIKQVAFVKK